MIVLLQSTSILKIFVVCLDLISCNCFPSDCKVFSTYYFVLSWFLSYAMLHHVNLYFYAKIKILLLLIYVPLIFLDEHNLSPSICMWFRVLLNQFASDFHKKMSPFLSCPINPTNLSKFQLAFQKFDHLSCRRKLKLKRNVVNGFKKGVIVRNIPYVKWSNF